MEKIFFYMMMAAVVLTTACNSDKDNEHEIEIVPGPNQMIMTTKQSTVNVSLIGPGEVTIDWGDNTEIENSTLLQGIVYQTFTHNYSVSSIHTIIITGKNITRMKCFYNELSKLDISQNKALLWLECDNNQLESLDISHNTELSTLYCNMNQLKNLDVSGNIELVQMDCSNNQLLKLDFSKNPNLVAMACNYNELSSEALNAMFETLHNNIHPRIPLKIVHVGNNPGTDDCDISIAVNKGWAVTKY